MSWTNELKHNIGTYVFTALVSACAILYGCSRNNEAPKNTPAAETKTESPAEAPKTETTEKPAEKPETLDVKLADKIVEPRQEFFYSFKDNNTYQLATGLMTAREQYKFDEAAKTGRPRIITSMDNIMFSRVIDADKKDGVSPKELSDYINNAGKEYCKNVKPEAVTGTGLSYTSPEFVYESKEVKDKLEYIIEQNALLQKETNDKIFNLYVKEWVAVAFSAPKAENSYFFDKETVAKYGSWLDRVKEGDKK